ncbi:hypothetical protein DBV15_03755 [Temnothorax longispinosus]|uniref:Uncharacterized protein n=1 Tax=Temnothorax longispinosus TaxID=300112 RepID=A0A4S2KVM9_9HYME|nr:hypothetical protein DBV15_03755 [Temnothorax longispinosus]
MFNFEYTEEGYRLVSEAESLPVATVAGTIKFSFEEFIPNRPRRNDQTMFKDSLQVCKLETIASQAAGPPDDRGPT